MSLHVKLETARHSRRAQVYMSGELVVAGGETVSVTIRDLSPNGVLVVTAAPLEENSRVEFRRGALSVFGHIAWAHGRQAGVRFDEPVPERLLETTIPKALVRSLSRPSF